MSKETKPADIARQSGQSQYDRPKAYCPGCGYHLHCYGKHSDTCTMPPPFVITVTVDQLFESTNT